MFPELGQYLCELWEQTPRGTVFISRRYHQPGKNLITQARRIIKRAGLKQWPTTFHNMRASRETELAAEFPIHVVTAWIGNSVAVATKHYLQVRDTDYERAIQPMGEILKSGSTEAVQNAVQQLHAATSIAPQSAPLDMEKPREMPYFPGFNVITSWPPRI